MLKPLLFLFTLTVMGCSQSHPAQEEAAQYTRQIPPLPPDDSLVLAGIDRLRQQVATKRSLPMLLKLDSVACQSDGYVGEAMDVAAAEIWQQQFTLTLKYLQQHPQSCLRHHIIWGSSADMSTEENRAQALATFRQTALDSAHRAGLSSAEMVFLQKILREVNPALLD